MIISPPFLPPIDTRATEDASDDPLMDIVDSYECLDGKFPIAIDRRWHPGAHLTPPTRCTVHAIADGEVVAYRVCQHRYGQDPDDPDSNAGFVLLKHTTDTGDGRTLTFYSLYMHLLSLSEYLSFFAHPEQLPDFLHWPTWATALPPSQIPPVKLGLGQKVYRKDVLGWLGQCDGDPHLHIEIFMRDEDFRAYFDLTQLGQRTPHTPASTDVWGHTYFVIPGGATFHRTPPGHPPAEYFPAQADGALDPAHTLYVEVFFHRGQRYTRSWLDKGDGRRPLPLSEKPVGDPCKDYEYTLYQRATALYPQCPSDGVELLRFGRILNPSPTLTQPPASVVKDGVRMPNPAPDPRATWVAVMFEADTLGYIDIHADTIQKLSDADFPWFTGWRKITDQGLTPFSTDGLCSHVALCTLLGDREGLEEANAPDFRQRNEDQRLHSYLEWNDHARHALRGFVCETTSEWDSSVNTWRFGKLNEPGGFFHERKDIDPDGYDRFLAYWSTFQFMEQTDFRPGEKLWFFHPLQFIRHFRRCSWLSESEFTQLLPREVLREAAHYTFYETVNNGNATGPIAKNHRIPLNKMFRKYGITTPPRMAAFFGNAMEETEWLWKLHERNLGAWYYPWDGRGFLQLTHIKNYLAYWDYRGRRIADSTRAAMKAADQHAKDAHKRITDNYKKAVEEAHHKGALPPPPPKEGPSQYLDDSQSGVTPIMIEWRKEIGFDDVQDSNPEKYIAPSDSAGFYWSVTGIAKYADAPLTLKRQRIVAYQHDNKGRAIPSTAAGKVVYGSDAFWDVSAKINDPLAIGHYNRHINGYVTRCVPYAIALAVLGECKFPNDKGELTLAYPEGCKPRR